MNYFELIKSVSKIKLGEAPTLFSEITDDEYNKITDEINNALEEFFLDDSHNFRRKDTTFNTIVGQQSYNHTYGVIVPNGLYLTDSDGNNMIWSLIQIINHLKTRHIRKRMPF